MAEINDIKYFLFYIKSFIITKKAEILINETTFALTAAKVIQIKDTLSFNLLLSYANQTLFAA